MNRKGFSLIEVLIALVILSFVIMALTGATVFIIRNNSVFEHQKVALELAKSLLSKLKSLPYNGILLSDTAQNSQPSIVTNISPDPDGDGNVYLLDDGDNTYTGPSDINDSGDNVDHPSSTINPATYQIVSPIEMRDGILYYKIWGIQNFTNFKRIVVVVYWFEGISRSLHYVSLQTEKGAF